MATGLKPAILRIDNRIDGVNFHDVLRLIDTVIYGDQLNCPESACDEYL